MKSPVTNCTLKNIRDDLMKETKQDKIRAWQVAQRIKDAFNYTMDESTIRGRFIEMGEPLSKKTKVKPEIKLMPPKPAPTPLVKGNIIAKWFFEIAEDMKKYIPRKEMFEDYIDRGIDKRLALHYDNGKYPLTQGKQGTGKTFSHPYYAYNRGLPFFLFSCHDDFKLNKLFGDKTIVGGNVVFKEGLFVKAIQGPSVNLFDEVNAISNKESFPFHALLQNRELFIKDADNGNGKVYKLHKDCKIGFAQNPKSAKYLGGNVKPSNFLGRCTYITYPEFQKKDIKRAIEKKFPKLMKDEIDKFTEFYFACLKAIDKGQIPVDISIRQLNSVIELYLAGLPLRESIEDGLSSIMDAASQPHNKEAFWRIAQAIWTELMNESECDKISKARGFSRLLERE